MPAADVPTASVETRARSLWSLTKGLGQEPGQRVVESRLQKSGTGQNAQTNDWAVCAPGLEDFGLCAMWPFEERLVSVNPRPATAPVGVRGFAALFGAS